jgi:hypothetical protein
LDHTKSSAGFVNHINKRVRLCCFAENDALRSSQNVLLPEIRDVGNARIGRPRRE